MERITGTVRRFDQDRGIGFITTSKGKSLFFMRRDIRPTKDTHRPMPAVGWRITCLEVPIDKLDERGMKLADQAIDIEVIQ